MASKTTVLVTGGAGFLGQHIVKLLQTKADHVTEIRVLDVVPYKNNLGNDERVPVTSLTGSIADHDVVYAACKDVDCVMHIASVVDASLIPDQEFSFKINVKGTENVIRACKEHGVKRLVYCSTMDVAMGKDNIYNGDEDNAPPIEADKDHLFPVYGPTKRQAERLVLDANSPELQTVSLRPAVMYGELDRRYHGHQIDIARKIGGYYIRFDSSGNTTLHTYVGNVAWSFLCAERTLLREDDQSKQASGQAYFISDDSPKTDLSSFNDKIFQNAGAKPIPVTIPLRVVLFVLNIMYLLLLFLRLFVKVNIPNGTSSFKFLTKTYVFSYAKATRLLDYRPLYTYEESHKATVGFLSYVLNGSYEKKV